MWHDIFFDQNNSFQWASIAAIVSFLAFCTSIASIVVTHRQGNKNRKSSTLASLRIEELKELRKEVSTIISLLKDLDPNNELIGSEIDSIDMNSVKSKEVINKYISHQNVLYSILYRENQHSNKFLSKLSDSEFQLVAIQTIYDLGDWIEEFEEAAKEYCKAEYEEIEKYI